VQYDTTINAWHTLPNSGRINASNPCSEYMSIDDSACNLASLNLMKFRRDDGELDVEAFQHACDVVFLAQEIAVGNSSYPTPEIERNAKAYRQLGLGYANLGALLMARGLAYDSDEGRAYAAAITALMTGRAYRKSAEIAGRMGAFAGYRPNAAAMLGVIAKHRASVGNIANPETVPSDLLAAARQAWDDALDLGEVNGYRNAQATVLAPTGTIPTSHSSSRRSSSAAERSRSSTRPCRAASRSSATRRPRSTRSSRSSTSATRSSARRTSRASTTRCSTAPWASGRSTTADT
jgi:ribonucleoside-diphosphate reductase alpha chain